MCCGWVRLCISSTVVLINQNKRMGLLYNHKNKNDMVVLSEESLENNEGELYTYELLPDADNRETEEEGKEDADVR